MREMLLALFDLVWDTEFAPTYWREGLIVVCSGTGIGKMPLIIKA